MKKDCGVVKMNKIIKIDGIEYIKKSEQKVKKEINLKDSAILDHCNILGIFPFIKKDSEAFEELETSRGFFKKINPEMMGIYGGTFQIGVIKINGTKYSKEYVDKIIKIAENLVNDTLEIFMIYDKKKKEFPKDKPVMFVFESKMCFILAPRVEGNN